MRVPLLATCLVDSLFPHARQKGVRLLRHFGVYWRFPPGRPARSSRTADIEPTLAPVVHGPGHLGILLVGWSVDPSQLVDAYHCRGVRIRRHSGAIAIVPAEIPGEYPLTPIPS